MMTLNPGYGQPVRSLQTFLRTISRYYTQIPPVIPDGVFGVQTRNAVIRFQAAFALPVTGQVDNDVWDKIITVYDSLTETVREPNPAVIFPSAQTAIQPGERHESLYPIQGILLQITNRFPSLGTVNVTGVHDEDSVNTVKNIQCVSGLCPNGVLDRFAWDRIAKIHEVFVSRNRAQPLLNARNRIK